MPFDALFNSCKSWCSGTEYRMASVQLLSGYSVVLLVAVWALHEPTLEPQGNPAVSNF